MIGDPMDIKTIKSSGQLGLSWLLSKFQDVGQLSSFAAIMLLLNPTITIDPFIIIEGIQSGLLLSSLISISLMIMSTISIKILAQSWAVNNTFTYTGLWKKCFGKFFSWIPGGIIIIAFFSLSSLCTYEFFYDISDINGMIPFLKDKSLPSKRTIDILLIVLSSIPAMISNKFSSLLFISIVGNIGLLLASVATIIYFIKKVDKFGIDPENKLKWWNGDFVSIIDSYSYYNIAYFVHPVIYLVLVEMKHVSEDKTIKIAFTNFVVTSIFNMGVGIMSYLMYYDDFESGIKIISKFPRDSYWPVIATVGAFLSNVGSNCAYIMFIVKEVCDMLLDGSSHHIPSRLVAVVAVVFMGFTFTQSGEATKNVVWSISSLSYYALVYIFPPIYYLKTFGLSNKLWGPLAVLIFILPIPFAISELYLSFS